MLSCWPRIFSYFRRLVVQRGFLSEADLMKKGDTPESQTAGTVWSISELVEMPGVRGDQILYA